MTQPLFPESTTENFISTSILPDELSEMRVQTHCSTLEGLLNYHSVISSFLESNLHNDHHFPISGPSFKSLFSKHTQYYTELDSNDMDKKLELIRKELTIHFLADFSCTQDISSYLKIAEDLCDKEEICEMILLLSKKHRDWYDEYSLQYLKWLYFLLPYFQYSQSVLFEAHRVLALKDAVPYELVQANIIHLKNLFTGEQVKMSLEEGEDKLGDLESILKEALRLKKMLVEGDSNRDNHFYYKLGVLSFLIQLIKSCVSQDNSFLKACLLLTLYINIFTEIIKYKGRFPSELLGITHIGEITSSKRWWGGLLKHLCTKLREQNQGLPVQSAGNIQMLQCLLYIMKEKEGNYNLPEGKLDPLILEAIDVIYENRGLYAGSESFYSGGYLNHNENYVYDIILLAKGIQEHIVKSTRKLETIKEKLLCLAENDHLRAFIQYKCFRLLKDMIESAKGYKLILNNWNLAGVSLRDVLESKEKKNLSHLSINLKYTLKLITSQAPVNNVLENINKDELNAVYRLFISKANECYCNQYELAKLKQIGIFLTGMLTFNLIELDKIRFKFMTVFIDFLTKRCQPDCWDILYLQLYFWAALQDTVGFERIMKRKSFGDLLRLIEDLATKNQFRVESFTQKTGLTGSIIKKNHKARRQTRELITKSFDDIENGIKTLYNQVEWNNIKKSEEKHRKIIHSLKFLNRKFMYTLEKWIECQIKMTERYSLNGNEILKTSFRKFIALYLHPAFVVFSEKSEWKIQEKCYQDLVPKTEGDKVKWLLRQAFYENTCQILTEIVRDIGYNTGKTRGYLSALKLEELYYSNIDTHADVLKDLTPENLTLLVLLCRASAFALEVTKEAEGHDCTLNKQQQVVLENNIQTTLALLTELIVHFITFTDSDNLEDEKEEESFEKIIQCVISMIKTVINSMKNLKRSEHIINKFLSDLFDKYFENYQKKRADYILIVFHTLSRQITFTNGQFNFKNYYCRREIFTLVVWKLRELIHKQTDTTFYKTQLREMEALINKLHKSFGSYESIKATRETIGTKDNKIQRNREFIPNLFFELDKVLDDFPVSGLKKKASGILNNNVIITLQIFESLFAYIIKKCDALKKDYSTWKKDKSEIQKVQDSLTKLKENAIEKFSQKAGRLTPIHSFTATIIGKLNININTSSEYEDISKVGDSLWKELGNHEPSLEAYFDHILSLNNHLPVTLLYSFASKTRSFETLSVDEFCKQRVVEEGKRLIEQFVNMEWEKIPEKIESGNILKKLQSFIYNVSKILLEMVAIFENEYWHQLAIEWIELVLKAHSFIQNHNKNFDLLSASPVGPLLEKVEMIILLGVLRDKKPSSTYGSIIKAVLSLNRSAFCQMQTVFSTAFIFDALLDSCLPDAIRIEMEIKRAIMSNADWPSPLKLTGLSSDSNIKEFEQTHSQSLVQILSSKFNIYSTCEDVKSDKYYSSQNLVITLRDQSHETIDPVSSIEFILHNMSANAKSALNFLIEILIDNFLSNITSFATAKPEPKFKETGTILMALGTILLKYPQLCCYIAFQKNDYSLLIEKYKQNLSNSQSINIEEYKSITVLECLFKIKYFAYNSGDFSILIALMIGPYGVTFTDPDNNRNILDVSVVTINNLLKLISQTLEGIGHRKRSNWIDSIEKYMEIASSIRLFSSIWYQVRQSYNKDLFTQYCKHQFLSTLKEILCHLPNIIAEHSDYPKMFESLIACLPDQLQYHYILENSLISGEEVTQFKYDNYQQFLKEYHVAKNSEKLKLLSNLLEINTISPHSTSLVNAGEKIQEKFNGNGSGLWTNLKTLQTPSVPAKTTYYYADKDWVSVHRELISEIITFCSYGPSEAGAKNISDNVAAYMEWNASIFHFYRSDRRKIGDLLHSICKDRLDKAKLDLLEPSNSKLKYYEIISEQLKSQNSKVEEKKEEVGSPIKEIQYDKNAQIKAPVAIPKEQIIEKLISESRIKYFKNLELQNRGGFEFIQRQILCQIKLLTERLLIESMYTTVNKEELDNNFVKEAVNNEISEQLKGLSEFEKNMYLCLIEQFEALSSFSYPENFPEIKEEYTWILANFGLYFSILACLRGGQIQNSTTNTKYPENVNSETIFPNEFTFCKDYSAGPATSIVYNRVDTVPENVVNFVKNLFISDDSVVESVISGFYVIKEGSNNSHQQMVSKLCHSALFEAKVIDYCFFFLYSPDHLKLLKQQKNLNKFPLATVYNQDKFWMTNTYSAVAYNILCFLKDILRNNEYLLQQPRVYFEKHGLQSIKTLKTQTQFYSNTTRMVSIADLLIGLLDLKEIQINARLQSALEEVILQVFSVNRQFRVAEVAPGDEMIESKKVLTKENGRRLMQVENFETLTESMMDFIPYELEPILQNAIKQQKILSQNLKDISPVLNELLSDNKPSPQMSLKFDTAIIQDCELELFRFEKSLSMLSYLMSSWILEGNESTECDQENKNELLRENFKMIHTKILENSQLCDLMCDVFRLASYLPTREEFKDAKPKSLVFVLFHICVYYYALICAQSEVLSKGSESQAKFAGINAEVSPVLKEKQKELGDLFYVMYKANLKTANEAVTEETLSQGSLTKSVQLISEKFSWLLLGLECKKKTLVNNIEKDMQSNASGSSRPISIDRRTLVKSTLAAFANQPLRVLKQKISVKFLGENGIDAGGLTREWLTIINRELFNPQTGLFQAAEDNVSLQISPLAKTVPSHLKYLQLAGIMLAKAIQQGCVVDVTLSDSLLKHILRRRIILNDLKAFDSYLTKSLEWILNNPIDGLDQYFTYETEALGQIIMKDLIPDGENILVTESNKREFVEKIYETKLKKDTQEEIEAFLRGFYLIIPPHFLNGLTPSELQLIISGPSVIDVNEIKDTAKYSPTLKDSELIKWLWEVLSSFTQTELSAFVLFVSGSPKIPYGGFKQRPFKFERSIGGPKSLPRSHTCFWSIELPAYTSKEELKSKLLFAILEGQGSFMFS